jgi:hypothetical protein
MPAPFPVHLWISLATSLGAGILAVVLWRRGLAPAYPGFVAYLMAECLLGIIFAGAELMLDRAAHAIAALVCLPLLWIFYLVLVREIHGKCLARFPGIAKIGQQVLVYGLIGAIILSVVTVQPDLHADNHDGALGVLYVTAAHRVVTGGGTLFLLLLTVILTWFPVPTSRNTLLHTTFSFFFFLSMTVAHLYRNLSGKTFTSNVNLGIMTVSTVCLVGWAFLLRPQGEVVEALELTPLEETSWILAHMEALNRALVRGVK